MSISEVPQLNDLYSEIRGLFGSVCRVGVLMDIIAGLQAFLRVAKPRLIGVTQPVIPKQVSGLEPRLGDRLIHRSTLTVTLTEEGREVIRSPQPPPRSYECPDAT